MKAITFNFIIFGLAMIGIIGFLVSGNNIFLALELIFGVWFLFNVVEFFIRRHFKDKPLRMMKE